MSPRNKYFLYHIFNLQITCMLYKNLLFNTRVSPIKILYRINMDFGAFWIFWNSITLVWFVAWGQCTKIGFLNISVVSILFFHFEPQILPCISYIQWLEVWKDYFRVQNDHKKDIVARGPFFTNHGDTDTKHLPGLLLSLILIAEHYYTSKNTFKLEIKMFLR